jgi:hypothetical protein
LDLIRKYQLLLGGCGGVEGMMAGYTAKQPLPIPNPPAAKTVREDCIALLGEWFDAPENRRRSVEELDELLRLLAMLRVRSDKVGGIILSLLEDESDPVRGIHLLNCYSVIAESTTAEQATQIGDFLIGLKRAIADRKLNTDRNWQPRMKELVALLARDPRVRQSLVSASTLGAAETLYVAETLVDAPAASLGDAEKLEVAGAVLAWCRKNPGETSTRHVRLFERHPDAANFLRSVVDDVPVTFLYG